MKKTLLLLAGLVFYSGALFSLDEIQLKKENSNLLRLEGLQSECMANYNDKHFCRKRALKQCRESLYKKECKRLLKKIDQKNMAR